MDPSNPLAVLVLGASVKNAPNAPWSGSDGDTIIHQERVGSRFTRAELSFAIDRRRSECSVISSAGGPVSAGMAYDRIDMIASSAVDLVLATEIS